MSLKTRNVDPLKLKLPKFLKIAYHNLLLYQCPPLKFLENRIT